MTTVVPAPAAVPAVDPGTGPQRGARVTTVAVIAHRKKSFGGGLDELRRRITDEGVDKLLWYEVSKSRKAAKPARTAVEAGAELVLIWGGDGMQQRCLDVLAGTDIPVGILPADTALVDQICQAADDLGDQPGKLKGKRLTEAVDALNALGGTWQLAPSQQPTTE